MNKLTYILLYISIVSACHSGNTVNKDIQAGLSTEGKKLKCDDVFVSLFDRNVENNVFTYGEHFYINYNDIRGFSRKDGKVFPGMEITVTDVAGDTVMDTPDVYSEVTEGFTTTPLQLAASLVIAAPMKSNNNYTAVTRIWDKNGAGTFTTKFELVVKTNEQLKVESNNILYKEIYLYSKRNGSVVKDGKIRFNDDIFLLFEGLEGLKEDNGIVFPGLSLKATDSSNNIINQFDDLFSAYSLPGLKKTDLFKRTSAHFKIENSEIKNPIVLEVRIWDKKSDKSIKVTTELIIG